MALDHRERCSMLVAGPRDGACNQQKQMRAHVGDAVLPREGRNAYRPRATRARVCIAAALTLAASAAMADRSRISTGHSRSAP